MKKLSIVIALLLGSLLCNEAAAQKHLVFTKGVQIDGKPTEMVSALAKKGFKYEETNDGVPLVIGKYEGYSDVEVNIIPKQGSDKVCAIRAELPARLSWVKLENDYADMKARLEKKYGKPSDCEEIFTDGPKEESSAKLVSLINNRCRYRTVFSCNEGKITLTLKHFGPICFVCVLYEDALNNAETTSL